jgi:hypothetical protein
MSVYHSLFVLLYLFFCLLYCLFLFNIRILITPLLSSNFSRNAYIIRHNGGLHVLFSFSKPVHSLLYYDNLNAHYCLAMFWRVMYRGKNKFEVMYTREQVHGWKIDLIIRLPRSNAVKKHNFKRIYKMKIALHTI